MHTHLHTYALIRPHMEIFVIRFESHQTDLHVFDKIYIFLIHCVFLVIEDRFLYKFYNFFVFFFFIFLCSAFQRMYVASIFHLFCCLK